MSSKVVEKITDTYDFLKDNRQDVDLLLKETNDLLNQIGVTSSEKNPYSDGVTSVKSHILKRETKDLLFKYGAITLIIVGMGSAFLLTRK